MRTKNVSLAISAGLALALLPIALLTAQAQAPAALTGQVTSSEEGAMEGVLVSAKKDGSTITITVVSDAQGRYSFPPSKLEPGQYALRIRAIGYDLDRPADRRGAGAAAGQARPQAAQDRGPRRADVERRMAGELPRHGPAEERDAGLRRLPHARAGRALDAQARRFHQRHAAAHAGLREPEHPGRPATAQAANGGWRSAATSACRSTAPPPISSAASI